MRRVLLRDAESRALLLALNVAAADLRIEGTGETLRIEEVGSGAPVVDVPVARLELLEHDAIHYVGATRIRDSRELRLVRTVLELS